MNANSKKMLRGPRQKGQAGRLVPANFGDRFSIEAEGHQLCSSWPTLPVAAEDSGRDTSTCIDLSGCMPCMVEGWHAFDLSPLLGDRKRQPGSCRGHTTEVGATRASG